MIPAYIEEVPAVFFENPGTRSRISSDALVNRHGARARSMCGVSLWLMTVTELILETLLASIGPTSLAKEASFCEADCGRG